MAVVQYVRNQHTCWRRQQNMVWEWHCQSSSKRLQLLSQIFAPFCCVVSRHRVELSENTRVDHRALAVSFHSSTFQCQTSKRTRIHTRAPPKVSRVFCGGSWRQEAFQQCAEMVAKITEAATQRETLRALLCRPSWWWIGAQALSALQGKFQASPMQTITQPQVEEKDCEARQPHPPLLHRKGGAIFSISSALDDPDPEHEKTMHLDVSSWLAGPSSQCHNDHLTNDQE